MRNWQKIDRVPTKAGAAGKEKVIFPVREKSVIFIIFLGKVRQVLVSQGKLGLRIMKKKYIASI